MKNAIVSSLFAFISLFVGSQAFAQGITGLRFLDRSGQGYSSQEAANAADRVRAEVYGNIGGATTGGNVIVLPTQRAPVYVRHEPVRIQQQGSGLTKCQAVGAIAGGTVGSLAENHTPQAVILLGIGGALLGDALCEKTTGQVIQQGAGTQGRSCPSGTTWRTLDWPGHPKHGQEACLPADAVIEAQKAEIKGQTATPAGRLCTTPGTSWKKLDWPGHPQHGKEACLPADAVIEAQKAANKKAS